MNVKTSGAEVFYNNLPFRIKIHSFASKHAWYNLPSMIVSEGIAKWQNVAAGKAAVVVAAGNSLEKALPMLKKKQKQLILIAAGSALGALMKNGIIPHFLVIVDPFELMADEVLPFLSAEIKLILPFSCAPAMAMAHKGDVYFYKQMQGDAETANLVGVSDFLLTDTLLTSLNVAVTAIGFSLYLGCAKVILTGLDLAVTDENKHHADGVLAQNFVNSAEFVEVLGQNRRPIKTLRNFAETISLLSQLLSGIPQCYVNASEGGAAIEGIEHSSFDEVVLLLPAALFLSIESNTVFRERERGKVKDVRPLRQDLINLLQEVKELRVVWCDLWVRCWLVCCSPQGENKETIEMIRISKYFQALFKSALYQHLKPMIAVWQDILQIDYLCLENMTYTKVLLLTNKLIWSMSSLENSLDFNVIALQKVMEIRQSDPVSLAVYKKELQNLYIEYRENIYEINANQAQISTGNELLQYICDAVLLGEVFCSIPREIMSAVTQGITDEYIELLMKISCLLEVCDLAQLQLILIKMLKAMESQEQELLHGYIGNEVKSLLLSIGHKLNKTAFFIN